MVTCYTIQNIFNVKNGNYPVTKFFIELNRKRIIVSVINDLVTDQRVRKVCKTLYDNGFDIYLVGRKLNTSLPMDKRPYKVKRLKLLFSKGPLFYICFNIRLFFVLLWNKADIYHANDLDTLLPNFLVSKLKGKPLIYDAHELFTEVPELVHRPLVQGIWKRIEALVVPRVDVMFTVNESIAAIYSQKYGKSITVIRNLPETIQLSEPVSFQEFGLNPDQTYVILQGAGINIDRGAEELVDAMHLLDNVVLIIAGGGDVIDVLKQKVIKEQLEQKVKFFPKMPYASLMKLTACASCGITLDKDTNLNYRYSLPNKLFDYIMVGIPVLASDLPEIRRIIDEYGVGLVISSHQPAVIAEGIRTLLQLNHHGAMKQALQRAAKELCWEMEQQKLKLAYEQYR